MNLPKQDLAPGDGVEVAKEHDENNGRAGHVLGRYQERYRVIFEPTADYDWFHLRPTGEHIDPARLPGA